MLRIPGKKKEEVVEDEPIVAERNEAEVPEEETEADEVQEMVTKVAPEAARYMGADAHCAGCVHFMEGEGMGECTIVSGEIDPDGVCMLFTPDDELEEINADETVVEPEVPTEEPIEE